MPDKIVLTYFNTAGRAELSRMIMAQGDIEFEDRRLTQEEWAVLKPKTPTGQLPLLEVNGTKIGQSLAIAHYLAKRTGLCGKDDLQAGQAEMIVLTIEDIVQKAMPIFLEKDEEKKAKLVETFETEALPPFVQKLEYILSSNGGQFYVGNQLTWADIAVASFFSSDGINRYLNKFDLRAIAPKMFEHSKKTLELPKIKSWIEKRPKTN